ncbi:hypothetical protein DEU56DRAFT_100897 [Suillus clintonianus]|uniref:uncharacterized protein n=1 Tax=Suillus clintonianus TaxID=1904413 RepID=UPI001B861161|nr:uncharacterized protein DEU56DRAFT_100897 [Suillus clintonianus]KAG2121249.1 hypothetical protein DEU56DRAFT_100897 [Suillus clintonianus]
MNFPNTWNRTPTPDQLVANQDVHDDDLYRTFSNPPGSLFCATDMRSMAYLNTAAADHQISSTKLVCSFSSLQGNNTVTSHPTPPTVGSWTSSNSSSSTDHNHGNFTEGRYSTQSISASTYQTLDMPPSQSAYPYSITANVLSSVPDYDPWHNPPTLHSIQHYNPELRGASIRHSYSPVLRSDDSSPSTSQKFVLRYHS